MTPTEDLCLNCFRPNNGRRSCPHCGFDRLNVFQKPHLNRGSFVGGRYLIGAASAQEPDGCVYDAWDTAVSRRVSLKEFCPPAMTVRDTDGKARPLGGCEGIFDECSAAFFRMWSAVSKIENAPGLVKCYGVVRGYGTYFAVTAPLPEETVGACVERCGRFDAREAADIAVSVCSALNALHTAGYSHLGVGASTVRLRDGFPVVAGLCVRQSRTPSGEIANNAEDGFAAPEQYDYSLETGTWTDVYSTAALLYYMLTGDKLPPAYERGGSGEEEAAALEAVPGYIREALVRALEPDPRLRTDKTGMFVLGLEGRALPERTSGSYGKSPVSGDRRSLSADAVYRRAAASAAKEVKPSAPSRSSGGGARTVVEKRPKPWFLVWLLPLTAIAASLVTLLFAAPEKLGIRQEPQSQTAAVYVETVTVPDLTGRAQTSVMADGELNRALNLIYESSFDAEHPAGYVYAQSVPAGTQAKKRSDVIVYVSLGREPLTVPQLEGMPAADADAILCAMGLTVTYELTENDGLHTTDSVASVIPASGTTVYAGDAVTVYIWSDVATTAPPTTSRAPEPGRRPGLFEWLFG